MIGRIALALGAFLLTFATTPTTYTEDDFLRVRKFGAHIHADVADLSLLAISHRDGFELMSINVDYPDFPAIADQAAIASAMHKADPKRFHFSTTFSMAGFGAPRWKAQTRRALAADFARGAVAMKVWKNIGMVAKDVGGRRVFIDDRRFDSVVNAIQTRGVPLIAHQGEPRNCWLPLDQMTTENDRAYFKAHPEYYMYLHPEVPSYEALMAVRDRFVGRHSKLAVVGAHMASLEWKFDELARFLDRYPNAKVDLAARMSNLQAQSVKDRERVRAFFIKYRDRLLYGTDLTHSRPDPKTRAQNSPATDDFGREADRVWRADWRYLATVKSQRVDAIKADAAGLALPRNVMDRIYYSNARRVFSLS